MSATIGGKRISTDQSISTESMLNDRHLKWQPSMKHVPAAHEDWKKMYSDVVDRGVKKRHIAGWTDGKGGNGSERADHFFQNGVSDY